MATRIGDLAISDQELTVRPPNRQPAERANRLREAVHAAGGNQAVSQRSGVPLGTLNNYVAGRDMKATALIALAEATNVTLDWLATGRGPMRPTPEAPPSPTPSTPAARASNLFDTLDIDRLVRAFQAAAKIAAAEGNPEPTTRQLVQGALIIYDDWPDASTERIVSDVAGKVRISTGKAEAT